jgi:glutathione S-transferase
MTSNRNVTLFHAPQTRSTGVLTLLEELGADYRLHVLNMKANEQRHAAYLKINPMGKVPAIEHNGAIVTEQVAVYLYLADLYPEAGLAPTIGDPLRGPYLRWVTTYGTCFEPAVVDRAQQRVPAPVSTSPYGDFDTLFNTLVGQLEQGPYLLGERFTAADVLWGTALSWIMMFKLIPESPVIAAYVARVTARPAVARASQKDAELVASQVPA